MKEIGECAWWRTLAIGGSLVLLVPSPDPLHLEPLPGLHSSALDLELY